MPALDIVQKVGRTQRNKMHEEDDDPITHFGQMSAQDDDQVDVAVWNRVSDSIDVDADNDHRICASNPLEGYAG